MGGMQRFERRLSGLVEGSFARIFRGKVEPVELAAALAREADTNKAVGPQRVLVPNVYDIDLGTSDYDRLAPYSLTLGDELASMVREHAAEQGYSFVGPVSVTLRQLASLSTGSFRIESRVEAGLETGFDDHVPAPPVFRPSPPAPPIVVPPAAVPPVVVPPVEPPGIGSTTVIPAARHAVFGHLVSPDGTRHAVGDRSLIIGRGQDADVRLSDSSVSRKHARISVVGDTVVLEDLGSTNGTTVNGKKISREAIRIGDTLNFGTAVLHLRG